MTPTEKLSQHPALAEQAMRDLQAQLQRQWQPIETAPKDVLVLVYTPPQEDDWPDSIRIDFDHIDSGIADDYWFKHGEHYEHFCCVAKPEGSIGPKEKAPYTHWMPLPAPPRCSYCDGTGDVHSLDGEWRGLCACPAGSNPAAL